MKKEGKLFGIINVIDLLVLIAIIGVVAVAGYFVMKPPADEDEKDKDGSFKGADGCVEVVFYTEEVSDFVIDKVNADGGSYVFDDACQHLLGEVMDVDVGESLVYTVNSDGETVTGVKEGYSSAYITSVLSEATRTRFGFTYKLANYGVGHSMVIRVDDAKIYLRVFDIHAAQRRHRRPIDTSSNGKYMEMFEA